MKDFLRLFGVDESTISPFCKKFENANEIRDEFMSYCPSDQNFSDDIGEEIVDENDNDLPKVETVQSLISKVQNNITNAINDDEIIEDEHCTDVDEIESSSCGTEFYNAVDGSIAMERFPKCLSCKNIELISHLTLDGICSLEMEKREKGSTSLDRKSKSLQQRWFNKGNYNGKKVEISSGGKAKVVTYVERDSLIELMCKQGKGRNQSETLQLYRVLALFHKHYNKWYIIEENKKEWYPSFPKGKYLVLASMVEKDVLFDKYEDVLVEESNDWNAHSIFVLKDASFVLSVKEKLNNP
jgi:hypothetical protein